MSRFFALHLIFAVHIALLTTCAVKIIPSSFTADRVIATPSAVDGRKLMFWVDTSGSGFLFEDVAKRYNTIVGAPAGARARLPRFKQRQFPPLTGRQNDLPLQHRSDVGRDPIFAGLDGQLGASWLQNRVWTFDYARQILRWRCDGSDPPHSVRQQIPLFYARDASGRLTGGVEYPQLVLWIDGEHLFSALDTAATVALSPRGAAFIDARATAMKSGVLVRATSFVKRTLIDQWHERHRRWLYRAQVGQGPGISAILVPLVRAENVEFANVWFTTRPDDDVFQGELVDVKLGPTAFAGGSLTIDYLRKLAIVQRR